jgi:glycyl-tRNA synthetase beta chain
MSERIERRDLLVEIGTEELPPKALRTLELAFTDGLLERLTAAGLSSRGLQSYATPRRLAVLVRGLASRQGDQLIKRRGPPLRASFDAGGAPTRAASAFADACGVTLGTLGREHDAKGNEYLSFEGRKTGAATVSLLPQLLQQSLDALPTPRRMRWGSGEVQFVRPVHWLLLLYGPELVPATVLGVASGHSSFGHRFMAPGPLRIRTPGTYARALLMRGKVLADFSERRARIVAQVGALAAEAGGRAVYTADLLDEVTALVEWPAALVGRFDTRFLELPREVLLSTLQEHQRYFAIESGDAALMNCFVTVSNIESCDPEAVRSGNERVVRARLADASFFWEQDRRQALQDRRPGLDAVTFQAQLGSLGARTERLSALAGTIATHIGADRNAATRAAQLAKCDLLTAMVGEFPDLQGTMGRYYALADGEPAAVADAIAQQYLPRAAGDALPTSALGDALALADKLDTLAGIFAIGQKPSGTRDPFGLRRAAIGVLRILLEHRLELDPAQLIEQALRLQPVADIENRLASLAADLGEFLAERLRSQYLERNAGSGISTEMFDAVRASASLSLPDFDARLQALAAFLARPEGASLAAANKRIANILKKSEAALQQEVAAPLLRESAELALHAAMQSIRAQVQDAVQARQYARALDFLAGLKGAVDEFFDHVLVNDPDTALRSNRLALLAQLRAMFSGIADLSRLPG